MEKTKLMRITAGFFALMICFTILSRAADQMSIAVVEVERPQNQMIEHTVCAVGKIVQNQELAVTTLPDQRVTAVYVREGERVEKGDVLFEIDLTLLEEKILEQQQEMEKHRLQLQDIKSQKEVGAQRKASEQAQAQENYALSTNQAGVRLSRAQKQLEQAKKELKEFRRKNGFAQADGGVEEALERTLEEKTSDYIAAQQELRTLEWEIENAVYNAKQAAEAAAGLEKEEAAKTRSAAISEEPELVIDEDESVKEAEDTGDLETAGRIAIDGIEVLEGADVTEPGDSMPVVEPGIQEPANSLPVAGADASGADVLEPEDSLPVVESGAAEPGNTLDVPVSGTFSGITQEELAQIEQSVRDSYSQKLSAAKERVDLALDEKNSAEAALGQYRQEQMESRSSDAAETEKQLLANIQAAQQAYEDAAIAANEAAVTSGRSVQMSGIPDASDSSDRVNEITYEQMELSLQKLEQLKTEKGRICADTEGLITGINIRTGEKTTDTTAILMADLSKGYRFAADIAQDQEKYIGTGDLVRLSSGDGKKKLEDLAVESVAADESEEGIYHVTVQIPENTFEIGASVTMNFSRKSEVYPVTVPLSALHLDERRQPYVLVLEQFDSVMGTEQRARKVSVTVTEQNESYAALGEGALSTQQDVIVRSDKPVDDGSRVRLES